MASASFGDKSGTNEGLSSIIDALKYFRSIHIIAMLLVGFGFLMVFVKRYGRSAITAAELRGISGTMYQDYAPSPCPLP